LKFTCNFKKKVKLGGYWFLKLVARILNQFGAVISFDKLFDYEL
jgi:hypothetical protein